MKIGIDFGTSFSLPAGGVNDMAVTLLPAGEYGIPSVFYYDSEVGVQIGVSAEENADYNPAYVKRDIKMEISSKTDTFVADNRAFSKKEIVGYIFREIARVSREECMHRALKSQDIEGVVISVPAAFSLRELTFIREAAQLPVERGGAGLKVLGFIREPVAAAISYFNAPNAEDEKTILVYDLGGGTCDVAIVRSSRTSREWYKVLGSEMERLGGRDWDDALIKLIKQKYAERGGPLVYNLEAERSIRKKAVQAKHNLSRGPSARVAITLAGRTHSCVITTDEFERATQSLLDRSMHIVDKLMRTCTAHIDYIVCVGGSSNMPQVAKAFEKQYPSIPVRLFEPDKAIAFGAAIYAQHLNEEQYLRDICKFSYGAEYVEDFDKYHDKNRLKIWNIIFKDTPLPASGKSNSQRISDSDDDTYIAVYESECTDSIYPPEQGTYIGDVRITGITNGKKGDSTTLTMTIDQSGLMNLKAVDNKTEKTGYAEIQLKDF